MKSQFNLILKLYRYCVRITYCSTPLCTNIIHLLFLFIFVLSSLHFFSLMVQHSHTLWIGIIHHQGARIAIHDHGKNEWPDVVSRVLPGTVSFYYRVPYTCPESLVQGFFVSPCVHNTNLQRLCCMSLETLGLELT